MSGTYRTFRRFVLWTVVGLVALELVWVVAANWALGSHLVIGAINKKPEKLEVLWGRAKTWFPGVIHVEDLSVRGTSKRQQWQVELARVRVHLALLSLPFKTFSTHDVEGENLRFSLDKKSEPVAVPVEAGTSDTVTQSAGVTSQKSEPVSTSKPKKSKRPWRFLLRDIHIDGSESIGVLGYTLSGDGSIDADLALELKGGPLALERTRIDWNGAELTVKGKTAAHDMSLDLDVSLAPFVPKNVRGAEVLGSLSGRIEIQGQTQGAGVANQLLSRFKGFAVGSSGGQIDGNLLVEKGILGPGSRFALITEEGWIEMVDLRVETALEVDVAVEAETGTRLSFAVDDVALSSTEGNNDPILEGARLSLVATSKGIDFSRGPTELGDSFDTVEVDLSDAHVSDVARFPIPRFEGFSLVRGDMTVASYFSASPDSATGKVQVSGRGIDALMNEIDLTGDLEIDLNLTSTDPHLRVYDLEQSEIKIDNVTMTRGDKKVKAEDEDWYAHITLVEGLFESTQPRKMQADVKIAMRDTRPIVAVFSQDKSVIRFFKGMLDFKDLLATAQMGLAGGATEIRDLDIDSEGLKVKSNLRIDPGPESGGSTGILWMKFHGINVGLDLRGNKTKVHLRKPLQWYEEQLAAWSPMGVETATAQPR